MTVVLSDLFYNLLMNKQGGQLQYKINISWSHNFAYGIGLIASDGCISKDGRHVRLISKDLEMIENFKKAFVLDNKIGKSARGGETEKKYYYTAFGDETFVNYLKSIGLTPAKSKTISELKIPDEYFADFLRGEFDGDGSFFTSWDKRWPKSFVFNLVIYSASIEFLLWIKSKLNTLYSTTGFIKHFKSAGVYGLQFAKKDSTTLANAMYSQNDMLFLKRKYDKIKAALDFNKNLHMPD